MKVLIATHNKSKFKLYKGILENKDINIISLNDLDINCEVEENGITAIENAIIKAKAYGDLSNLTTICIDDSLNIDNIPENINPGVNVRRVNNKTLNDSEMIEYYSNLAKKYGDNNSLSGRFIKGIAIYHNNKINSYEFKREIVLTDKISGEINEGYPLNSIIIDSTTNKHISEHTEEDKEKINKIYYESVKNFIYNILN